MTKLPCHQPVLKKHYFYADSKEGHTKEFQRHAYQLIGNDLVTLVHYVGDETEAANFSHGNMKEDTAKPFVRTCPSTLRKLESACSTSMPGYVYKEEVSSMNCHPEIVSAKTPCNMKQLRNMQYKHLHQSRISQDTLYNLHELAYDISGYV